MCKDAKVNYSYENTRNGFKFILYRNRIHSDTQRDILDVTLDVSLNGTEKAVYAILKQKPEFAGKLSFYLSAVDGELKSDLDNPTLGLLLCKGKDQRRPSV